MKLVKCKCGENTTNLRTKKCDTCKIKKMLKEQEQFENRSKKQ